MNDSPTADEILEQLYVLSERFPSPPKEIVQLPIGMFAIDCTKLMPSFPSLKEFKPYSKPNSEILFQSYFIGMDYNNRNVFGKLSFETGDYKPIKKLMTKARFYKMYQLKMMRRRIKKRKLR